MQALVLVGGEPGVGKSTLLLTALRLMSESRRTLLITGEESVAQVKLRAERSGRGDGRVYTIAYAAKDPSGASCSGTVTVTVPHDRRGRAVTPGGAVTAPGQPGPGQGNGKGHGHGGGPKHK